ncbi:MAG: hypothetical protein JW955_20455 [Sedimentisphaerales bacterium]|nr:hypothetical protein [Sedimentisphaerales bacterium]
MKRRIFHPVTVAVALSVCLAAGGLVVRAGQEAPPNEGTPRVMYVTDFVPGTRVVLLDNEPAGGPGLKAGMTGTILCCDRSDCSGRVLVSWSLWRGGSSLEADCAMAVAGLYPDGSTIWVDPAKVRLGLPFENIGILESGPEGCLYLSIPEGGRFRLVINPEFRERWWVASPGNRFRVRGLLNRSTPAAGEACPQADGDIYHPILIPSDWDVEPGSWAKGPFYNLDRVVLVGESNPHGAVDLPRGITGTVICNNQFEKDASLLVSWDLWGKGGDAEEYLQCTERLGGLFPPGSTSWVSPHEVAKYYETGCGVLEETVICARGDSPDVPVIGLFVELDAVYCLPDIATGTTLPRGLVKATGLYTPYEEMMGRQTNPDPAMRDIGGIIFDSIVMPCHVPSCCDPPYVAGDRVRLLVNQPGGAEGLIVGAGGRVLCCNPDDPFTPILVSWDNWTGGGDEDELCQTPPGWYPDNSTLWMACSEIKRVVRPDLCDQPEFRRFVPQTIEQGKHVRISGMIYNRGGANSGPFFVYLYLSTDVKIGADDYLLSQMAMDIDAGGSAELSWLNAIPTSIPAGQYYVGWLIDPENRVVEEDEANNMILIDSGQLTVTGK